MRVKDINEVVLTNPDFKQGWELLPNHRGIEDLPKFGAALSVGICDDSGKPLHDQLMVLVNPGAVGIPIYSQNDQRKIGIITQTRPLIVPPHIYRGLWTDFVRRYQDDPTKKIEYFQDFLKKLHLYQGSSESMEFPSGYPRISEAGVEDPRDVAIREVIEEFGGEPKGALHLGYVNATSLFPSPIAVYAVEMDPSKAVPNSPDQTEHISRKELLTREELNYKIRSGRITNGFSLSALALYDAYMSR